MPESVASHWDARRVLVTGGAGFLGAHVVAELQSRGCQQVMVPRSADWDLRDVQQVGALFASERPHVVIHLAAVVGGIEANRRSPGRFFHDNALMGIHVVDQARRQGVDKLVAVGTVCAYPKHTPVPFREEDLWSGYPEETNAPYGLAKRMLLVQLQAYRQEYGFEGICLFPVNLYGPGDHFDLVGGHVIPALIRKFTEARDRGDDHVVAWGSGEVSREFLYVGDAARGIVAAAESYDAAEPVNLGTGREIKIKELAELIKQAVGFEGEIQWDRSRPDGQPRRCVDVSRARDAFAFEARMLLEEGLRRTVAWYETARLADREVPA